MKIDWSVDDGYAGAARPQLAEIEMRDVADCESAGDLADLISECVDSDFRQKINWVCPILEDEQKLNEMLAEAKRQFPRDGE